MANWYCTDIIIRHEDPAVIAALTEKIDEWTSHIWLKSDFGNKWLGNIVGNSGIGLTGAEPDYDKENDAEKYVSCCGSIDDYSINAEDKCELSINQESKWGPVLQLWKRVVDKYAPGAEIRYTTMVCEEGTYCTNDADYSDTYYLDQWDPFPEWAMKELKGTGFEGKTDLDKFALSANEIKLYLTALFPGLATGSADLDTLLEAYEESELSDCGNIHKWEYASIDEWNY